MTTPMTSIASTARNRKLALFRCITLLDWGAQASTLPTFDRVEGYDSGHCDDVQQKHDQKRPRQFHVRLRRIFEVRTGSGSAARRRCPQFLFARKDFRKLYRFHLGKAWTRRRNWSPRSA